VILFDNQASLRLIDCLFVSAICRSNCLRAVLGVVDFVLIKYCVFRRRLYRFTCWDTSFVRGLMPETLLMRRFTEFEMQDKQIGKSTPSQAVQPLLNQHNTFLTVPHNFKTKSASVPNQGPFPRLTPSNLHNVFSLNTSYVRARTIDLRFVRSAIETLERLAQWFSNVFFPIPPLQIQTLSIPPQQKSQKGHKFHITYCEETIYYYEPPNRFFYNVSHCSKSSLSLRTADIPI